MDKFFGNLHRVLLVGLILAIVVAAILHGGDIGTHAFWAFVFRWIHVWFGILWIGLLYYFNFVQIPSMPKIPDEHKPAIGKVIAQPDVRNKLTNWGLTVGLMPQQQLASRERAYAATWARIIKASGFQPQ